MGKGMLKDWQRPGVGLGGGGGEGGQEGGEWETAAGRR